MKDDLGREEALEKLVASRLRARLGTAGGQDCPDAEVLAAYFERALAPKERASCEAHLAGCLRCQEQLAQLARLNEADAPVQAAAAGTRPASRFGWAYPGWAWAGAGLVAVVIVGLWYSPEFRREAKRRDGAEVSAARPAPAKLPSPPKDAGLKVGSRLPRPKAVENEKETVASYLARPEAPPGADRAETVSQPVATSVGQLDRAEPEPGVAAGAVAVSGKAAEVKSPEPAGAAPVATESEPTRAKTLASEPVSPPVSVPPQAASRTADSSPEVPSTIPVETKTLERVDTSSGAAALFRARLAAAPASSATGTWRVGPRGLIQKADARGNWVTQPSGVAADLYDIVFPSPSVGWAVGQSGTVLRTVDGGLTWTRLEVPAREDLIRVIATNEQTASVVQRNGQTLSTRDGGKIWGHPPE